jgi:dihydroflavonol-4-reductase
MAARIIVGDIRKVAEFARCIKGVDVVFHTAAYFREYYKPGDHFNDVEIINVKGTMELAQVACAMGVGQNDPHKLIGHLRTKGRWFLADERTPPWQGAASNLYLKVEPLLFEFAREKGRVRMP